MSDEEQIQEVPQEESKPEEQAPQAIPNWQDELAKLDPQEFRKIINKHPALSGVIGGIVGIERDRAIKDYESRKSQEDTHARRDETEAEMMKLFEDNAEYVQQHYPRAYERFVEMQEEKAKRELDGIQGSTIKKVGMAIGRALADVPEWTRVTNEDKEKLASMILGKSDEEALAIFNHEAWKLVAEVKANDRLASWKEKELSRDREALRQEEASKLMKNTEAPDLAKPKGQPAKLNIKEMTEDQFNKYWESVVKRQ